MKINSIAKGFVTAAAVLPMFASALVINTTDDANVLSSSIVGSGITITSATFLGSETSAGTFSDGISSGLGIDSGIILTSGDASLAAGPNNDSGSTGSFGGAGDSDLSGLIGGANTFDATVLEMDFTTDTSSIFFNFSFASEEYNEYVNSSFNDVFGLFVDGVNIALADNGDPLSINNVNCGNPYSGAGPNCDSYNNNAAGIFDIEYDGFTDVFNATISGLSAGTHTLKLAIADAGDSVLDSAIFIQGGSLTSVSVPEPATLGLFALGLAGLTASRRKKALS
jgi:hypothetical protein